MPWQGKPFGWGQPVPYLSFLPESSEATVNVLRYLKDLILREGISGEFKSSLTDLEAPSTTLLFPMLMKNLDQNVTQRIKISSIPNPDPRKSTVRFKLWKYWGKTPRPAVKCPADAFIRACASLATQPYDYNDNWHKAKLVSQQFDNRHIRDLLAVMVHPPNPSNLSDPWVWIPRVQLAAAQIVAGIERKGGVMPHDSNLVQLLEGPIDWVVDAAIITMTQWCRLEKLDGRLVYQRIMKLMPRIPSCRWTTYSVALHNILLLPGIPDQVREQTQQAIDQFEAEMAE